MVISNYSINGYWLLLYQWLLVAILLMAIVAILLKAIGYYFINGY
jgi:hypothetical protein